MSRTASTPPAQDFVPFATAALDFHRSLNLPGGPLVAGRAELDSLHEHLVAVFELLDAQAVRTSALVRVEGDCLRAASIRVWQAADHLHSAYHAASAAGTGEIPDREAIARGLPEGAPELTICRRHQIASHLVRRRATPTDLQAPFTGLTRH